MNKVQKAVGILPSQEILDLIDKKIITSYIFLIKKLFNQLLLI